MSARNLWLGALAFVALALALRSAAVVFTPDSFEYLAVARGLIEGAGLHGTLLAVDTPVPRPLDLWPPGYPVMLAGALALGLGPGKAASAVNFFSLFAAAAALLAVQRRRPAYVVASAIFLAAYPHVGLVARCAYSEPLMMGLVAAAFALDHQEDSERPGRAALVGAVLGLAMLVRYAALFGAVSLAAGRLLEAARRPERRLAIARYLAVAGVVAVAFVLPWLARNIAVFGRPFGAARQVPWGGSRWSLELPALAAAGVLGAALLAVRLFRERGTERGPAARMGGLMLYPLCHLGGMFLMSLSMNMYPFHGRLFAPAAVGLAALAGWLAADLLERAPLRWRRAAGAGAAAIALASLALTSGRLVRPGGLETVRAEHAEVVSWAERALGEGDVVAGHRVWWLHPFTRAAVISDGHPEFGALDARSLATWREQHGGRYPRLWWLGDPPREGDLVWDPAGPPGAWRLR